MTQLVTERHGLLTGFRLGEWLVKPDDGSLVSSHRVTRLEPLLMELLVFLCSQAGQVVSKQDVLKNIWRNRWVSDGTVKASFYQLRKALGDSPRKPRFIETLPKRGYRILIQPIALTKSGDSAVLGDGADELYRNGRSILSGHPGPAALKQARRGLECDPLSLSVRRDVIETLFAARHYDETIAEANRLMEMTGHSPDVQLGLVWVYFLKGDESKAFHSLCTGFRSLGTGREI